MIEVKRVLKGIGQGLGANPLRYRIAGTGKTFSPPTHPNVPWVHEIERGGRDVQVLSPEGERCLRAAGII
ncbi:MAG: hypothetical protein GF364_22775 [Candidatus Lokiarchaeota archaeon]|nr:hypothetical protein [Candidatus Lokiarchaeota archaeon]